MRETGRLREFNGDAEGDVGFERNRVYNVLAEHQNGENWFARDLVAVLHEWAERFNAEFKLEVPEVTLRVDKLRRSCLGHFRYGHNGFGLRGEIGINARYLPQQQAWEVLGTLLHELLHAWQQAHGSPSKGNYHNCEFRNQALLLGLIVDERGCQTYVGDSPFTRLLQAHGVALPPLNPNQLVHKRERGESKMKKWSCGCTNVRCAVDLRSVCLKCAQHFRCSR